VLRACLKNILTTVFVLIVSLVIPLIGMSESGGLPMQWSVSNSTLKKTALILDSSSKLIEMKEGWSCTVGATSVLASGGELRATVCSRGGQSFEFSVECGAHRLTDYAQVGLHGNGRKYVDYIEVSCKYSL
jgi:hypothetical protein